MVGQLPSFVIGRMKKNSVQAVKTELDVFFYFCVGLWLFFMYSEYHSMSFDTSLWPCESNVVYNMFCLTLFSKTELKRKYSVLILVTKIISILFEK